MKSSWPEMAGLVQSCIYFVPHKNKLPTILTMKTITAKGKINDEEYFNIVFKLTTKTVFTRHEMNASDRAVREHADAVVKRFCTDVFFVITG